MAQNELYKITEGDSGKTVAEGLMANFRDMGSRVVKERTARANSCRNLVINRAIPIKPVSGMFYYTNVVKIKYKDVRHSDIDVSSFAQVWPSHSNTVKIHRLKGQKFKGTSYLSTPAIITTKDFIEQGAVLLIELKGYSDVYQISSEYSGTSGPITRSDIIDVAHPEYETLISTSDNIRLEKVPGVEGFGSEYRTFVTKPCLELKYWRQKSPVTFDLTEFLPASTSSYKLWRYLFFYKRNRYTVHCASKSEKTANGTVLRIQIE